MPLVQAACGIQLNTPKDDDRETTRIGKAGKLCQMQ